MAGDPTRGTVAANKISQILGEVLIHHAPWTAQISEQTRRRITDDWLEKLEAHATTVVKPFIDKVTETAGMPEELAELFEHAAVPKAQFGATIQQFFIYGVMFSLASTALAPFTQVLSNDLWTANPTRPLSPPDISTAVIRGLVLGGTPTTPMPDWAAEEAAKSGIDSERMQTLIDITGMPPAPQDLFQMVRRQIITEDQLQQGLREGDTRDEWIPLVSKLRYVQPSPVDMVAAAVQNQLPYADAAHWAQVLGLEPADYLKNNPDWFKVLYVVHGRPPGPVEMAHAALRGIVPWTGTCPESVSFAQAVSESDVKDKYIPVLQALATYYPPPGEVKGFLVRGAITEDQAVAYWKADGIPDPLAKAYAHEATYQQTTTDLALAKSDVLEAVQEKILSDQDAIGLLSRIGYSGDAAATLVEMAHFRYNLQILRTAVNRVASLYTGHKIDATECKQGLASLGLPANQVTDLLAIL